MDELIKRYYKEVKLLLPVHGKHEKRFLSDLKLSLVEFAADFPGITYSQLCKEFGEPREVIINYYANIDADYLRKQLRRVHLIRIGVICVVCLIAIVCIIETVLIYLSYLDAQEAIITKEVTVIE